MCRRYFSFLVFCYSVQLLGLVVMDVHALIFADELAANRQESNAKQRIRILCFWTGACITSYVVKWIIHCFLRWDCLRYFVSIVSVLPTVHGGPHAKFGEAAWVPVWEAKQWMSVDQDSSKTVNTSFRNIFRILPYNQTASFKGKLKLLYRSHIKATRPLWQKHSFYLTAHRSF